MQTAQRQPQRKTLGLFQAAPLWNELAPATASAGKREVRFAVSVKCDSVPALLAKEHDCCNRATD